MTDTATIAETLRGLLEKVTQGPYEFTDGDIWIDTREQVCCGRGVQIGEDSWSQECCGNPDVTGGQELVAQTSPTNAPYFAACHPDNIRAILDERDRLNEECQYSMREIAAGRARAEAAEAEIARREQAVAEERGAIAEKARQYAEHYPPHSDGRNTFILLAEWIEARA